MGNNILVIYPLIIQLGFNFNLCAPKMFMWFLRFLHKCSPDRKTGDSAVTQYYFSWSASVVLMQFNIILLPLVVVGG